MPLWIALIGCLALIGEVFGAVICGYLICFATGKKTGQSDSKFGAFHVGTLLSYIAILVNAVFLHAEGQLVESYSTAGGGLVGVVIMLLLIKCLRLR